MTRDNPEFITCAMDAVEEGVPAQAIEEECSCRLGLMSRAEGVENHDQQPKEYI